jgi:hypothetical protein
MTFSAGASTAEAWYRRYATDVVVGAHTPEFAFEHVVSDVRAQAGVAMSRRPASRRQR